MYDKQQAITYVNTVWKMKKSIPNLNKIDSIETWGINAKRPVIIAGPCSAESEEQVMETAKGLKEQAEAISKDSADKEQDLFELQQELQVDLQQQEQLRRLLWL